MDTIKCLLVGDDGVGKASLMMTYSENSFLEKGKLPQSYRDIYINVGYMNEKQIPLHLCNILDGQQHEQVNILRYQKTSIIILCFSLVSPDTLKSIQERWIRQINNICPNIPKLVVGTKLDVRNLYQEQQRIANHKLSHISSHDNHTNSHDCDDDDIHATLGNGKNHVDVNYITTEVGKSIADEIGAVDYVECSSYNGEGRYQVFDQAIKIVMKNKKKTIDSRKCILM